MNTINSIREQLQEDLLSRLDGLDNDILDDVCDIVIQNFNSIKMPDKLFTIEVINTGYDEGQHAEFNITFLNTQESLLCHVECSDVIHGALKYYTESELAETDILTEIINELGICIEVAADDKEDGDIEEHEILNAKNVVTFNTLVKALKDTKYTELLFTTLHGVGPRVSAFINEYNK